VKQSSTAIFVDSNIPMYLIGKAHPNKDRALAALEKLTYERARLVTSAEVYQEILHRYSALGRLDAVRPAMTVLDDLVDEVFDVTRDDVKAAAALLAVDSKLSSRDALHLAMMERRRIRFVLTFDRAFERARWVTRLPML
jgi:predicted nucleic acid-binding protein